MLLHIVFGSVFLVVILGMVYCILWLRKSLSACGRRLEEFGRKENELRQEQARFEEDRARFADDDSELGKKEEELIQVDIELKEKEGELRRWETSLRMKEGVIRRQQEEIARSWGAASSSGEGEGKSVPETFYPDFESLSAEAALLKEYCRWRAEPKNAESPGYAEKKAEFDRGGRRLSLSFGFFPDTFQSEQFLLSADCYEAIEIASRLTANCLDGMLAKSPDELLDGLLQMCANAYCYLKTANQNAGFNFRDDPVQQYAYRELIKSARQNCVLLHNIRADCLFELDRLPAFLEQLAKTEEDLAPRHLEEMREPVRQRIRESLKRIAELPPGPTADWNSLAEAVTELVEDFRVSIKSKEIRQFLTPILDKIPDDIEESETFRRAVQYLEVGPPAHHEEYREPYDSDEVKKVRKAYGSTRVVFVGGTPQPHIQQRLKKVFKLSDLLWEEWSHGDSLDRFRAFLNDGTVRLFLIYIPWCSHKHSLELPKMIQEMGKDYVRLRKGTGINQIAAAICEQAIARPAD